jgi:hypothetical protein
MAGLTEILGGSVRRFHHIATTLLPRRHGKANIGGVLRPSALAVNCKTRRMGCKPLSPKSKNTVRINEADMAELVDTRDLSD